MTARKEKQSVPVQQPRLRKSSLAPKPAKPKASFHKSLRECAKKQAKQPSGSRNALLLFRQRTIPLQQRVRGAVTRAWSWLHAKYTITATKRLRVSETVSLGDKRFVALVNVEGREFLIGGGSSGVSLLAQWGSAPESAEVLRRELGVEEICK